MSAAAPRLRLRRAGAGRGAISIVPLIDVLLIMLVFFMVTSTYLDLDMVPLGQPAGEGAGQADAAEGEETRTLFVRIAADGGIVAAGARLDLDGLSDLIAERLADAPGLSVLVLPSARSDLQTLVAVMDRATEAGVAALRIVRLASE